MRSSIYLVQRQVVPRNLRLATFGGGIAFGLLVCLAVLMIYGISAKGLFEEFVLFVLFDSTGLSQAVTAFIPLVLVGLAAAAALRTRFWNIGIEGQVWVGAVAATAVATNDIGPPWMRLLLMAIAAVLAGAAWIGIAAVMKLKYGVNEIISTLMLTYVAFQLVQHLLFGVWRDASSGFPVSPELDAGIERLPLLGWGSVHAGLIVAIVIAMVWWHVMEISRSGFYMDAVGSNPLAAKALGMPVLATTVVGVILSGGLAGLTGMIIVAGQEYRLTQHIADGYTFSSIVIAFVARFRPLGVVIAAFIIGIVYTAGETLKVYYELPASAITLLEAIILLSLLIFEFFSRYKIGWRTQ